MPGPVRTRTMPAIPPSGSRGERITSFLIPPALNLVKGWELFDGESPATLGFWFESLVERGHGEQLSDHRRVCERA
jgi:hypothetical protein